jgi:hypothetical protein
MPLLNFFWQILEKIINRDWGPEWWRYPVQAVVKLFLVVMLFLAVILLLSIAASLIPLRAVILIAFAVAVFAGLMSLAADAFRRDDPRQPVPMPQPLAMQNPPVIV